MTFTKKAINAAVPRINYIRNHYLYRGQTGTVPAYSKRLKHFIVYENAGKVDSWVSGYGDAMPGNLYHGEYIGVDVPETVEAWLKGDLDRGEVVNAIHDACHRIDSAGL
jgi:hypothetical protein